MKVGGETREELFLFSPNEEFDNDFSGALKQAAKMGIKIYAYKSKIKTDEISLGNELRIFL